MNKKKKPLTRQISFRVSNEEYKNLHEMMEKSGYGSMAIFVREIIKNTKIKKTKYDFKPYSTYEGKLKNYLIKYKEQNDEIKELLKEIIKIRNRDET